MKERPILMQTENVKAILAGTKTMTRRLTKLHDYNKEPDKWNIRPGVNCQFADSIERNKYNIPSQQIYIKCPYGLVGGRLWVRESFWIGQQTPCLSTYVTFVDGHVIEAMVPVDTKPMLVGKHPSIHLPRYAARIWLEITGVRVERLQEITENDALAEGVDWYSIENKIEGVGRCQQAFRILWNSLNAKRGYGWDTNPWVWVLNFKRIDDAQIRL